MKSILLILFSTLSLSLAAQDPKGKSAKWQKMHDFMPMMTKGAGISFVDFDGLKSRMAGFTQYAPLKDHIWTISMGSMHVKKNLVNQMTITAGSSLSGDAEEKSSALRILGIGADLGYDVIPAERIMLYPMAGLGVETYHAIFYKDVNAVNFNDVANFPTVQNNIRSLKFTNTFLTYRLGLGFALKAPNDMGTIALQGGYVGGFKDHNWKSGEYQALNGAPSDDLGRINISLVLTGGKGMMGMMRK